MNKILNVSFLLFVACTSGSAYSWGDASQEVADSFCANAYRCLGGGSDEEIAECSKHVAFHLCEIDSTCDSELPDGSAAKVSACVEAMDNIAVGSDMCNALGFYGAVPQECLDVLALNPSVH